MSTPNLSSQPTVVFTGSQSASTPAPVSAPTELSDAPTDLQTEPELIAANESPLTGATTPTRVGQPVSLLLFRLVLAGVFFYLALWVLYRSSNFLINFFPQILPDFTSQPFFSSSLFFWGTIIFLLIMLGMYLWWRSIYIMISPSEVVVHGGIIIRQQKVLKRVGISIRSIELRRTLIGTILNYVTVEIGSELLGGVSITISDDEETLATITTALKPGEVNETKKFF